MSAGAGAVVLVGRVLFSIVITLDTYSHAIPGLQEEAAERMAALLA